MTTEYRIISWVSGQPHTKKIMYETNRNAAMELADKMKSAGYNMVHVQKCQFETIATWEVLKP